MKTPRVNWKSRAVWTLVAAVVPLGIAIGPASGDPGKPIESGSVAVGRVSEASQALNRFSDWLAGNPAEARGLAGLGVSQDTLTIQWSGEIPETAIRSVAEFASVVDWVPVKFSAMDTGKAVERIAQDLPDGSVVMPSADYSGLVIEVPTGTAWPKLDPGMPYTVREIDMDIQLAVGRSADVSPFYGGAQIQRSSGTICSTGFAVTVGGVDKMVTARHCGVGFNWSSPAGSYLGTTSGGNLGTDSTLLNYTVSPGASTARIYTGSWTSTTSLPVIGTRVAAVGDDLCAQGAWTGQRCNNQITGTNAYITVSGQTYGPGFWAKNPGGNAQAGEGDSGGPGVHPLTGPDRLRVVGMIDAIDGNFSVPCQGFIGTRACSTRVFYINVGSVLSSNFATLKT